MPGCAQNGLCRFTRLHLPAAIVALAIPALAAGPVFSPVYPVRDLMGAVDNGRIEQAVRTLAAMGSRVPGRPGNSEAAEWVAQAFREIGLEEVTLEPFQVVVPATEADGTGASLTLRSGEGITLYPLWPNLIRTCQTPPGGITAPIIDAGKGLLSAYNHTEPMGSIVLLDFNSGRAWYDARMLGASAILFAEPESTLRQEAEEKFSELPLDVPRFLVRAADVARLREALSAGQVSATIECDTRMRSVTTWNVVARMSGRGGEGANVGVSRNVTAETLNAQAVVLSAYYDSISIAPDLAPGADSASGLAVLLETARALQQFPPQRDVIFLASSAHSLAMQGVREFIASRVPATGESPAFRAFISLDLSTHGRGIGAFWKSHFYWLNEAHTYKFSDLGVVCDTLGKASAESMGIPQDLSLKDTINTGAERHWSTFLPLPLCMEGEAATLAGYCGLTLASMGDARPYLDTPFDTPDRVDFDSLGLQARVVCATLPNLLADVTEPNLFTADAGSGFAILKGGVYEFGKSVSFLPSDPVPGAIACWLQQPKTVAGVRRVFMDEVDADSKYQLTGMPNQSHVGGAWELGAFHCDAVTGDIDYAPDFGPTGAKALTFGQFVVSANDTGTDIVLFGCRPLEIYDTFDPANFSHLADLKILDRQTNAVPFEYGRIRPSFRQFEPAAVVFGKPGKHFIVTLRPGGVYAKMLVLNATPENYLGEGMLLGQDTARFWGAFSAVKDLWTLDDARINDFSAWGVGDKRALALHAEARSLIGEAETARQDGLIDQAIGISRKALSIENRVYPKVEGTARDVVNGVLFYLILLIPFAYLTERLMIAARLLKWQATWTLIIFGVVFGTLVIVHPAFRVTTTPVVVLLAFILAAMAATVGVLVIRHFDEMMEDFRYRKSGQHTADVARLGTAGAAFSLGVANMRRRKLRSTLTCVTLIMLTFTVLSFTAVTTSQAVRAIDQGYVPTYQGLLIRTPGLTPFAENAYTILRNEIPAEYPMAPRAWLLSVGSGIESVVPVWHGADRFQASALLGCSAAETAITPVTSALVGDRSRWFTDGEADRLTCIIPSSLAERYGIGADDVDQAAISVNGFTLTVIGVFDERKMDAVRDLDNESIMPVDEVREQNLRKRGEGRQRQSEDPSQLETKQRIPSGQVVIVPYDFCLRSGGPLRSISVGFGPGEMALTAQEEMVYRLDLSTLSGVEDKTYYSTSIAQSKVKGLEGSAIPMLIAALIVLNTMLGSVYERIREIAIYSSLGLSPTHVGTLFIAESTVYAVMGAMVGYVAGQTVAKVVVHHPEWGRHLSLNYSSLAAVGSTLVVMAVVFLSTLFPARKAAELATPGVERRWRMPEPQGDSLQVRLPFTVARAEAPGCFAYIAEYLDGHSDYSLGEFSTDGCTYIPAGEEHGHRLLFTAWLSPYDLGVSERVTLVTSATDEEEVLALDASISRISGDDGAWLRTTRSFIYLLRRQFLLWRILGPELKAQYHEAARQAADIDA